MGQAKRRSKKKEFTFPRIALDKAALKQAGATLRAKFAPLESKWQQLPKLHRRALAVLVPVVVVLALLPSSPPLPNSNSGETVRRELVLNLDNKQQPEPVAVGERPEPPSPKRPTAQPVREAKPEPAQQVQSKPLSWEQVEVKKGQTLANIFREHALPLADLYAVAAIEGDDKPLSRVKAGQLLRYKQTAKGDLDALQIEGRSGDPIMFFRRSDGSFARSQ
ncbi:hypothetical protein C9I98_25140 [Photobacterium sanctipauli]|uniref:Lysine transporter LysM n=1 Tax=Photobacterium sanctipauli TaxID=1342794 RepID=A0A2T3NA24_9GAMM|nr:LysM-like peptidoglycan-binding domain-containing protein [Photobacterium sanctipauli]PSW10492.1 hypothetical protein C9I98_25140 [Photobacterium sanctipauli]